MSADRWRELPLFDRVEPAGPPVLTVGQLNRGARAVLEGRFGDVWVEGEVSDSKLTGPGHLYFTLCEPGLQGGYTVSCVCFRGDLRRTRVKFEPGEAVRVRGQLTVYEPRGRYQLQVRQAEPTGEGALKLEIERLKKKLEAEGLFEVSRKRPLPMHPRTVGVVTSQTGAAIHDIIRVASERFPSRILLSPCVVQGSEAPLSIVRALELLAGEPDVEVIIVGRGGGSAEDLMAFNDERVVRAVAACRVPVVSAVGHEVDTTLCDLVADLRAATPSNAAELVVPTMLDARSTLAQHRRGLERAAEALIDSSRMRLLRLDRWLLRRGDLFARGQERLRDLYDRARRVMELRLRGGRARLGAVREGLARNHPSRMLEQDKQALATRVADMNVRMQRALVLHRHQWQQASGKLHLLSPLAVLARGYSVVLAPDGKALTSSTQVQPGDSLQIIAREGRLHAKVEDIDA